MYSKGLKFTYNLSAVDFFFFLNIGYQSTKSLAEEHIIYFQFTDR